MDQVLNAQFLQLEDHGREVAPQNFGVVVVSEVLLERLVCVESETLPRLGSACSTRPSVSTKYLCLALAWLIGLTKRLSTRILGLYTFYLLNPGSITYTIPSIVKLVSAMFVATMHFRPAIPFLFFSGAGSNIRCYIAGVNVE